MSPLSARALRSLLGVFALCAGMQTQEPQMATVVRIFDGEGQSRGRTGVREHRPPVPARGIRGTHTSFFYDNKSVRDEKGRIISGLGIQAWEDGSDVRLAIYTLVPGPGAPNVYLASTDAVHLIRPTRLAEFVLKLGEQRQITELKKFGMKPWTIKVLRERR